MISQFYSTFQKRNNSTKIPEGDIVSTALDLTFKGGANMDSPTILLELPDTNGVVPEYTYMRMRVNGTWRYYFVNNPTCVSDNLWQFDCVIDVLGTYKDDILNNICYVMYSTSHGSTLINDTRALLTPYTTTLSASFSNVRSLFRNSGYYSVFQCMGDVVTNDPSYTCSFLLDSGQASALKRSLMSENFFDWAAKWFTSPMDAVVGCAVTAYNPSSLNGAITINVGGYNTGASGSPINSAEIITRTDSVNPKSALSLYGDYRDLEPYTSYGLYLPFVGVIQLPSLAVARTHDFIISAHVAPCTGDVTYDINYDSDASTETPVLMGTYSGNCSSSLPVAGTSADYKSLISSIGNTIGNLTGLGTISGVSSSINGKLSSMIGASSGITPFIFKQSVTTSENPTARRNIDGLPYGATVRLSTLSGYCQCINASVNAPCSSAELDRINAYLNGGFYIE